MEVIRKKICKDEYVSHLPGRIPCIEYNGNSHYIVSFPNLRGGNMGHFACDLLITKINANEEVEDTHVIRYLDILEKYHYVRKILDENLVLVLADTYKVPNSKYYVGCECPEVEDVDSDAPILIESDEINKYSCKFMLDTNINSKDDKYVYIGDDELEDDAYIVVSQEELDALNRIKEWYEEDVYYSLNNLIQDGGLFVHDDEYLDYCERETDGEYDNYEACWRFCFDFEKLFLGERKELLDINNLDTYWDDINYHVQGNSNATIKPYFVAPYLEIPICLESEFVDEGIYTPYDVAPTGFTKETVTSNGVMVNSIMLDVLLAGIQNKHLKALDYVYDFEDLGISGILFPNSADTVYECSVDEGEWSFSVSQATRGFIEINFLGDVPYLPDAYDGMLVKPAFLNGEPSSVEDNLFDYNDYEVIMPTFYAFKGLNCECSGGTADNGKKIAKITYSAETSGKYTEEILYSIEKVHTNVLGQETDLWMAVYEYPTVEDENGTLIHVADMFMYRCNSPVEVTNDDLYYFDPAQNGILDEPKIDVNFSIDRGAGAAWEKHFKLMECNTLEDLENYGNNFFNIREI